METASGGGRTASEFYGRSKIRIGLFGSIAWFWGHHAASALRNAATGLFDIFRFYNHAVFQD